MFYSSFYQNLSEEEIAQSVKKEGFEPIKITNSAGDIYRQHTHPETKLLAFLEGSMNVTIEDKTFLCKKGDKVIIPGNTPHSAVVGNDGCTFFWSEKLL